MSTIVCIKERSLLVLGTDSRRMRADFSGIESDAVEKIIELAPQTYVAPMGRRLVTDFQERRARELARETTDIRALAAALDRESGPVLRQVLDILTASAHLCAEVGRAVSGEIPFHRFLMAGYSGGELGWVCRNYTHENGEIVESEREWFGAGRRIYVSDGDSLRPLSHEPATWQDDPIAVVARFLGEMRRADPCVGGSDQIIAIDGRGGRWISRLPAVTSADLAAGAIRASDGVFETGAIRTADIGDLQVTNAKIANATIESAKIVSLDANKINAGTISVAISLTSPTLTITSGTTTVNIDATNKVKVADSGVNARSEIWGGEFRNTYTPDAGLFANLNYLGVAGYRTSIRFSLWSASDGGEFKIYDGSGNQAVFIGYTGIRLVAGKTIQVNAQQVLAGRQSAVGDANTSHACADFAAVNAALDALGTKINAILDRIGTPGHGLTSD